MAFAWRTADSRRLGLFQAQNSDWSEPWPPRVPQPEVKSLRAYFRSNLGGTLLWTLRRPGVDGSGPRRSGARVGACRGSDQADRSGGSGVLTGAVAKRGVGAVTAGRAVGQERDVVALAIGLAESQEPAGPRAGLGLQH